MIQKDSSYELSFVSKKNFKMQLKRSADGKMHAYCTINKSEAILSNLFVHINGGTALSPNVDYVILSGIDPISQIAVSEKMIL